MGRKNLFAAVLILLLLFQPLPSVRAASRTGHITKDCTLSVSVDAENKRYLSDDNFLSIWRGGKKSTVRIDSPRAIGGLYIRWEKIPANWEVRSLKGEEPESLYNGAGSVFLHQYVPITSVGETSLELCLTSGGAIADLFVLADGDPVPDWVQRWKPMWDKADMLLVSTHADDELLWFGGAMPVYAGQFQKKVQVAYVTNHGPQRTHELLDGLWTVGVVAYPMISSFPDRYCKTFQQALEKYDENAVLEYQVSLLRRFKPDVVLGQDINGEYGHGVHQLNTYTLRKALENIRELNETGGEHELINYKKKDGATKLTRVLMEESTEVHFLVGQALNEAHQNPGMPVSLGLKFSLIGELAEELRKTGKRVTIEYF